MELIWQLFAAVSDPQDISGLVLVSLVAVNEHAWQLSSPLFPVCAFHGENDPLGPEDARALLSSFFGNTTVPHRSQTYGFLF
jgi:hypothetical protein